MLARHVEIILALVADGSAVSRLRSASEPAGGSSSKRRGSRPVPSRPFPPGPLWTPSPSFPPLCDPHLLRRPCSSLPLSAMELPRSQSRGEGLEFEFDLGAGSGSGSGFGPAVPTEDDRIENVAALLRSVSDIAEMEINGTPPRPSSFDAAAADAAALLRPRQATAPPLPPQQQQRRQQQQPQRPPPVGRPLFRPPPPAPFSAAAAAAAAAAATQARSGRGRAVSICDLDGSPPPGCSASFASLLPRRQEVHPSQPSPPAPSGTSVRITPVSSPRLGFLGSSLELVSPGRALTMPAVAVARDGSDPSSPSHLSPGLPRKVSIEFDLEAAAEASAVPAGAGAGAGARAGRPLLIRKRFCWRDFPEVRTALFLFFSLFFFFFSALYPHAHRLHSRSPLPALIRPPSFAARGDPHFQPQEVPQVLD